MLDKNGIIKYLIKANASAAKELEELKGLEHPSLLAYQEHIHQYVMYKLLLDEESDITTREINTLVQLSVEKATRLNPQELELFDVSKHCGATTSSMTKKVLLYLSLAEDMEISLTNINTADIETTQQLAEIIYHKKMKQETDYDRI